MSLNLSFTLLVNYARGIFQHSSECPCRFCNYLCSFYFTHISGKQCTDCICAWFLWDQMFSKHKVTGYPAISVLYYNPDLDLLAMTYLTKMVLCIPCRQLNQSWNTGIYGAFMRYLYFSVSRGVVFLPSATSSSTWWWKIIESGLNVQHSMKNRREIIPNSACFYIDLSTGWRPTFILPILLSLSQQEEFLPCLISVFHPFPKLIFRNSPYPNMAVSGFQ